MGEGVKDSSKIAFQIVFYYFGKIFFMLNGSQLFALAMPHIGEKYILGSIAPKNDKNYNGPWDCAEFASWLVYQVSGRLYGCANNFGEPSGADAYSGYWARDAAKLGTKISVQEAAGTRGAALVRLAGKDLIGHVAISNGAGKTVEAHSTKTGVIVGNISNRRWDFGVLVPWINYEKLTDLEIREPGKIYRYKNPQEYEEKTKEIQKALGLDPDGFFGLKTFTAVRDFQRVSGLVADGEVGFLTAAKLGITL
jgi:hypothetical protein